MALKITKASDPITVSQIVLCVYAQPGVGKTSLAFTAEAPLLLDFDAGAHRSQFRKDCVQIAAWSDVENMTADDLAPYKTVAVDTSGRALDVLAMDIIAKNPKHGRSGALTLQGFGELKSRFIAWTKLLRSFGKDVVLIAHMDEQRSGDDIIERLDVQGGSKGEIYKVADAMGRMSIKGGKRILSFDPTDAAYGKNPAHLEAMEVPHFDKEPAFLANVIGKIKGALNESSAAAVEEQLRVQELRDNFNGMETVEQFNKKVAELAKAEPKVKAILVAVGEQKGFRFDKKAKTFSEPEKAAA